MTEERIVVKTIHGLQNYATGGINVIVHDLHEVVAAGILNVSSGYHAQLSTRSGIGTERLVSISGNVLKVLFYDLSTGRNELANGTSLSGITLTYLACGY